MNQIKFQQARKRLISIVDSLAAVVLIVMTLHVVMNALSRSLQSRPIEYTLEYVQYWYLPIIAMLGFLSAQLRGRHIVTDLIFQALPPVTKRAVAMSIQGACALVMAGFAWGTWGSALHSATVGQSAGVTDIPTWPVYFLVSITFSILAIEFGAGFVELLRNQAKLEETINGHETEMITAALQNDPTEVRVGRQGK